MMCPGEPWSKSAKTNLGGVDNGSGHARSTVKRQGSTPPKKDNVPAHQKR